MDFAFVKNFKISLEIECLSKKCCPDKTIGNGKVFKIDIERKHTKYGIYIADVFNIIDGNNCCYSSKLTVPNIKCPYCNKEHYIELI